MPFKLAPRLDAICYIGVQRYFLTICARERRRAFTDSACAVRIVAQLLQTAASEHFSVIAYCLMPDHLHVRVEGLTDTSDFSEFVRLFKQKTSFEWKQQHKFQLW